MFNSWNPTGCLAATSLNLPQSSRGTKGQPPPLHTKSEAGSRPANPQACPSVLCPPEPKRLPRHPAARAWHVVPNALARCYRFRGFFLTGCLLGRRSSPILPPSDTPLAMLPYRRKYCEAAPLQQGRACGVAIRSGGGLPKTLQCRCPKRE